MQHRHLHTTNRLEHFGTNHDLGRPDRLIVALTHYNFKSIFAWNIFLYTGFIVITAVYLWMLMERRFER